MRSALLTLLNEIPFEQVTVRMICQGAGIHYTTFFRHHPSKEALLDDIAAAEILKLLDHTVPNRQIASEAAFLSLCRYVDQNRTLWTVLLTGGARNTMREELLKLSMTVASSVGAPNGWLPLDLAIFFTSVVQIEIISWWLKQPADRFAVEDMAKILHQLVISPTTKPGPL